MSEFFNRRTQGITPYVPGEQPANNRFIKLNTNESPYPPSPEVSRVIREFDFMNARLYPDPNCTVLREAIANKFQAAPSKVFVGNGSDEILAMAFQTFFETGEKIKMPDISYAFYPVYAELFGQDVDYIPLKDDFTIDPEDYYNAEGGVVIANPNAPTGISLPAGDIEKILINNPHKVVLIDEAYVDFGGDSVVSMVEKHKNLLVVRTFSKSAALAGIRVGYAIADEALIKGLNIIKNSFNSYTVNCLSLKAAEASVSDVKYNEMIVQKIIRTRERLKEELVDLSFEMTASTANFLFVRHSMIHAEKLFRELRKKGILVRYFNKPRINNYLRITIGTDEETDLLITALKEIGAEYTRNEGLYE